MPSNMSLLGFIAAALVLLITPGPGVLYVVARSVSQGHRAGLVSALGLAAGVFVHIAAAAAGISAILLASATAFGVVKVLGAGYLIYLGIQTLFARGSSASVEASTHRTSRRLFIDGVLVSALNPKIALFFLAFLPQFVDPSRGPVPQQILFLGLVYVCLAILTDGAYALLAGSVRHWLGRGVLQGSQLRYLSGSIYVGLGVGAAFISRRD